MRIKSLFLALSATAALSAGTTQAANVELVTNGDFETGDLGQIGWGCHSLAGWSTSGYNFLFDAASVDASGDGRVVGESNRLALWGPNNGGAASNTLGASPLGGKFVGADGAYEVGAISQTITGLSAGQQYVVSFYWGGAQQEGYTGVTTEQWKVSLGGASQFTEVKTNVDHGFTGWEKVSMTFTAGAASQVLSFLAIGTPNGLPPFSVLDGVSMISAVPEPETWAMMGLGLGLIGFAGRRRKAAKAAKAA